MAQTQLRLRGAPAPRFEARLARTEAERRAAERLRYEVFVAELGGDGPLVDHAERLERDAFDPYYEHLVLLDHARAGAVVGVYRLMTDARAAEGPGFYTSGEYDLSPLLASGRRLLELGRSCLHREYRGGAAMVPLWQGVADYVRTQGIDILFGVASFHGTDLAALALPLSFLHHRHLAPETLRVRARSGHFQRMDLLPPDKIDRKEAMLATPALIKAYLRLGGFVGEGAYVDKPFNTTDVCLILDTARMNSRQHALYETRAT
jgi:putative hemolysin